MFFETVLFFFTVTNYILHYYSYVNNKLVRRTGQQSSFVVKQVKKMLHAYGHSGPQLERLRDAGRRVEVTKATSLR